MKRSIDEASKGSSQLETQAASLPSESSGSEQTRMVGGIESNQKLTMTDVLLYMDAVKYKFREEKEKYDEFLQAMIAFKAQRTDAAGLIARVKEILKGHRDLLLGFNIFLPKGHQTPVSPVEKKLFAKAVPFLTKVKETFQTEDHVYKSFVDILSRKQNNSMSIKEEVAALFQHHPDIYSEFTQFLPDTLVPASNRHAYSGRNYIPRNRTAALRTMLTVPADKKDGTTTLHADPERPKSDKDKGIVKENTEQRWLDEEERVEREDVIDSRNREEGDRDLAISEFMENEGQLPRSVKREDRNRNQVREKDNGVKNRERDKRERDKIGRRSFGKKDAGDHKISSRKAKLDLSKCEQCTPSYRLLPENYQRPIASQRSKLEDEVLNDDLVNVTSGSEDYSFKHMRKNPHAEMLFKCEDDRFELDMLIESAKATTKQVEELLAKMNNNTNKMDSPIRIEEHFTAQSLRCIEHIYGEHGLDFMELLKNKPQRALTLISSRLKQKQEEWASCRSDLNKIWAEVYAENHHKSLDHRSSFKK